MSPADAKESPQSSARRFDPFTGSERLGRGAYYENMSNSLVEVKAVLDEVMEVIDDRTWRADRALLCASQMLLGLEVHKHTLPDDLNRRLLRLLSHLSGKALRRHPEICIGEIKRFYVALLSATQLPAHRSSKNTSQA